MIGDVSFTHLVLIGALVSAAVGIGVLVVARRVTGRQPGLFELVEAVVVSGVVALVQYLMVEDGFGQLHVAYLYAFVTLPVIGAAMLLAVRLPGPSPTRRGVIGASSLLVLGAVGFYGTHIEPNWIRTERVRLDVEPLARGEHLRVGVLADLQTNDIGSYEEGAVDRLMAEEPDIIVLPGDYFQADGPEFEAALPELRALLGRLHAPGGVFMTQGDVESPEHMASITDGLDGIRWLDEEVVTTEVRGMSVAVGGISIHFRAPRARATMEELSIRAEHGDVRILVSHRPDAAFHVPEGGADLVVAGHTHGGQVQIPFFGPVITLSGVSRDVAAGGLHEVEGIPIYLSNGVGMERRRAPQVRLNDRPSVGLVTLA